MSATPLHDPTAAPLSDAKVEIRNTTCYMCACRCGIRVHLRNGEVRYIEGNPDHPLNQGVICAKGSSGIMKQYSPARLTKPLLRKAGSDRGEGQFEEIEWEAPVELPLRDMVVQLPGILSETAWADLQAALRSPLFETPVAHFLVRAYLADGIDEFLAHLTMLEAALGTVRDYPPRPKPDPHKHLGGATQRMAARVSRLLGSPDHGKMYSRLFDQRSAFLHGRPVQPISVEDRVSARRLARRVVLALIEVAGASAISSREDWLDALLANAAGSRSTR